MNTIESLKNIKSELKDEWIKKLDYYFHTDIERKISEEEETLLDSFFDSYKNDVMDGNVETINQVHDMIGNELVIHGLEEYAEKHMSAYYAADTLRAKEKADLKKVMKIIDVIFDQDILRYNPFLSMEYEKWGFPTKDVFSSTIEVVESLAVFAVSNNLHPIAIKDLIYKNLRLSNKTQEYITDKIDENFYEIQMSLLVSATDKE